MSSNGKLFFYLASRAFKPYLTFTFSIDKFDNIIDTKDFLMKKSRAAKRVRNKTAIKLTFN